MNIPWPRLHRATVPTILAVLLALTVAAPGTSRAAAGSRVDSDPSQPVTCPCTLWASTEQPSSGPDPDTAATELGVKFQADRAGYITGVRFWKDATNTGTHTGSLWSASGDRLATATFTGESDSGWQQVNFAQAVVVTAGTTYVASYQAPNGRYSADQGGLTTAHVRGPLTAPASEAAGGNGVYLYGAGFPNSTWNDTNYWVDPVFNTSDAPGPAPAVIEMAPTPGETSVPVDTNFTATFDREVQPSTIRWEIWQGESGGRAGTTTYNAATRTTTFDLVYHLSPANTYFVDLTGVISLDGTPMPAKRWTFTTADSPPPVCNPSCTIRPSDATPAVLADNDAGSIEVGVKFGAHVQGFVTGLRFYKGPGNTGPHTGTIWAGGGYPLATATFTNESESGWQQVTFAQPVWIAPNATYVASYFAPEGRYSSTAGGLTDAVEGTIIAPASGSVGGNGVYKPGSSGFPSSTTSGTNFWVDVVFTTNS
ncbi:DUF4082 domain-containing protein [Streptomyces sp. SID3343]|uniref:DUF4082 domain-containing protein n=1 Tax=Streptomyces sp. SID3343 TaxID=2690260 RepID=UPI001F2B3505|nr:DUF4082 domain-containing protein [Streptomyces sp. SID3343]